MVRGSLINSLSMFMYHGVFGRRNFYFCIAYQPLNLAINLPSYEANLVSLWSGRHTEWFMLGNIRILGSIPNTDKSGLFAYFILNLFIPVRRTHTHVRKHKNFNVGLSTLPILSGMKYGLCPKAKVLIPVATV